jgi:primosomal protein N' (replication factor Y)
LQYADVSVNSPSGIKSTFSYHIPEGMKIQPGQAVWVPFGKKTLQGIVVQTSDVPGYEQTRDITGIVEPEVVLEAAQLELGKWISSYYLCPLFQSLALMLPPGFTRSSIQFFIKNPDANLIQLESLGKDEQKLFQIISATGSLEQKEAEKHLGKQRAQKAASNLVKNNLIHRSFSISPAKVKPKKETHIELAIDPVNAVEIIANLPARPAKQAALLNYLVKAKTSVSWREASQATNTTLSTRKALEKKNLVTVTEKEIMRRPLQVSTRIPETPLKLNTAQTLALEEITKNLKGGKYQTFLLHGVTGSGKTEVYLQALAEAIKLGKRAIVLVPEISLTPQTIQRFTARFPNQVAVLHSSLSLGERYDQWREIKEGKYNVVIGARSAIFAPQPNLGLVVIDEEHEWSYKQDAPSPYYHARTVALALCTFNRASLVLGTATPDVETYHNALAGEYKLLELPERITQGKPSSLPEVTVVDLKKELVDGNRSIFSRALQIEIQSALERKEQVILFLNRRGGSTFVQCRNCGYVATCRRCQISLSYHPNDKKLVCHHCGERQPTPETCPECSSNRIKYLGLGTQSVEAEVSKLFPQARVLRWDSDTTRTKNTHENFLKTFLDRKADILVGTQMIAKGMDFPGVSVVGVISADTIINLPDFRAGERTFALLCQVAGRAGRGTSPGKVIIQSYFPDHYAIQAAANHDYRAFFNTEITYRRLLSQPPYIRLARLVFSHTNVDLGKREALRLMHELKLSSDRIGLAKTSFIGPAPAFYQRLKGHYRWSIIIKSQDPEILLQSVKIPPRWKVDVDPIGLD